MIILVYHVNKLKSVYQVNEIKSESEVTTTTAHEFPTYHRIHLNITQSSDIAAETANTITTTTTTMMSTTKMMIMMIIITMMSIYLGGPYAAEVLRVCIPSVEPGRPLTFPHIIREKLIT